MAKVTQPRFSMHTYTYIYIYIYMYNQRISAQNKFLRRRSRAMAQCVASLALMRFERGYGRRKSSGGRQIVRRTSAATADRRPLCVYVCVCCRKGEGEISRDTSRGKCCRAAQSFLRLCGYAERVFTLIETKIASIFARLGESSCATGIRMDIFAM